MTPGRFAMIPTEVLAAASPRGLQLYALIARHADADGRAWPSREHLADEAECSVATVKRAVAELRKLGALQVVEHRATRSGWVNVYALGGGVTSDPAPVDAEVGGVTSDPREWVTSDPLNESHGNETHPPRARACESPPTPHGRAGGSSVDELLQKLPARITRQVSAHHRRKLQDHLDRTNRSTAWMARQLNEGPDLALARSPGGVLVHRLGVLIDEHQGQGVAA